MNTEMVRKEIAGIAAKIWREEISVTDGTNQILSVKGIRIIAENQDLPITSLMSLREAENVRRARADMLKAGFKKVELLKPEGK